MHYLHYIYAFLFCYLLSWFFPLLLPQYSWIKYHLLSLCNCICILSVLFGLIKMFILIGHNWIVLDCIPYFSNCQLLCFSLSGEALWTAFVFQMFCVTLPKSSVTIMQQCTAQNRTLQYVYILYMYLYRCCSAITAIVELEQNPQILSMLIVSLL